MPAYTYCDYVYLKKNIDTPNDHHNHFIFNQKPDFYITAQPKLMDDTFASLPKLFVNEIIKTYELPYKSCGSVIKSRKM